MAQELSQKFDGLNKRMDKLENNLEELKQLILGLYPPGRKKNIHTSSGEGSKLRSSCCKRYHDLLEKKKTLPVWLQKEEFLKNFKGNQTLLLVGESGCGKSTQVPQFVLEAVTLENQNGKKYMVACTQPSKVTAMSVSRRVADEMDVTVGEEVGYSIRFEDCSSSRTVLKYVTDDMLLSEALTDPLFERYKVIILDEAQERTLATDILFGHLKEVLKNRPDLQFCRYTVVNPLVIYFSFFLERKKLKMHVAKLPKK